MFKQLVFSKAHPACHNIVIGIKPGSDSKKTDKHTVNCRKNGMLGRKVIYVRRLNWSYNNVAKGIHLLDEKAFFVYTGKILCK